jgi:acetyl esterase/lipase
MLLYLRFIAFIVCHFAFPMKNQDSRRSADTNGLVKSFSIVATCLAVCAPLAARAVTLAEFFGPPAASEVIAYGTEPEQTMVRFAPAGLKPGEARPAIVLVHGGAWVGGGADVFYPHARYFASRGMVAFSVNYRLIKPGGPGMRECADDCRAALKYIHRHAADLGVNSGRIAVMGDSAGGHLAAVLGTIPGDGPRPAAMVLCNPIVDLTDPKWIPYAMGGAALEKKASPEAKIPTSGQTEFAKSLSPQFHVSPDLPPTLILHGTEDHVVAGEQVRRFAEAMTGAGNRCEVVLIEGARHAFIVPKYTAPEPLLVGALRRADAFLSSLGLLNGEPALEVSSPPAWEVPAKKNP